MAALVVVSGPPGAGKSTVASRLADRFERSVLLRLDDVWAAVVKGAIPPYLPESDEQNQTVVAALASAAAEFAAGGFTTVVDGVVGPWMLHHFRAVAERHPSIGLHCVVLRPDRDVTLRRAQRRTNPDALVDAAPVLDLWDQVQDLGALANHAVDSTRLGVDETVHAVLARFEAGTLRIEA